MAEEKSDVDAAPVTAVPVAEKPNVIEKEKNFTTYEPSAGQHISEAAKEMVAMANAIHGPVVMTFNGITLRAVPGAEPETVAKEYTRISEERHQAYIQSTEYAQRQKELERRQSDRDVLLKDALAVAPALELKDPEKWQSWVYANSDPYGSATVRYAEKWGRLMQSRISRGDTLENCADEASHIADNEGITGFMYGCAVAMLAAAWIHGEQLRRWHNLKTQIGSEGETANESGGVLNPALLNIGNPHE